MKSYVNYFIILVPGFVWGGSFILTRLILPFLPPFSLTLLRNSISLAFLLILLTALGGRVHRDWREWLPIIGLAVCNTSAFLLTAWGQLFIPGGLTTILAATIPFFTIIIAHFVSEDDRITSTRATGIVMGLIGVVILVGTDALSDMNRGVVGQLAILTSALLYGLAGVYARPILARQSTNNGSTWIPRVRVMAMQTITSVTILTPVALISDRTWTLDVPPYVWGYLVMMGVGVTAFATLTYYYLIQSFGSTLASMTMYIIPISGVTLGVWVLNEVVTPAMPIAALLILGGVFVANRPKSTPIPKPQLP